MQNQNQNSLTLSGINIHKIIKKALEMEVAFTEIRGDVEIVQMFIEAGANVNARPEDDRNANDTYLDLAITNNNTEMVQILIEAGADVNLGAYDESPFTPLMNAVDQYEQNSETAEIVRLLLEAGADVEVIHEGETVYDWIQRWDNQNIDDLIAQAGGNEEMLDAIPHNIDRLHQVKVLIYLNRLQRYQDKRGLALLQKGRRRIPSDVYNMDINPFL